MRNLAYCPPHADTHPKGDLCPGCRAERRAWRRTYRARRSYRRAREAGRVILRHAGDLGGLALVASVLFWCVAKLLTP